MSPAKQATDEDEREAWRVRGNRLRAAREASGVRSAKALAEILGKGFSYGKLARIESGAGSLSPADADYIAKQLGLPSTFFTAPLSRLGDVLAGSEGVASSPAQALAELTAEGLDELDRRLDRAAAGGAPDRPDSEAGPGRTGTQP